MAQNAVLLNEIDGSLGALPPGSRRPLALVGPTDDGPVNTPATFAGSGGAKAILANFKGGPAVEAAVIALNFGVPVCFVRTAASVLGAYLGSVAAADGTVGTLVTTGFFGTSTPTIAASPLPNGAYSVQVIFPIGGTIGTNGIVYQISTDGGQTWGLATALGTATSISLALIGTVALNFAAGTVVAGSVLSFATTAPIPASAGTLVTVLLGGTSTPTIDNATHPNDDYEARLRVLTGGTVGTTGITISWSLDGGRTESTAIALGTNNYFIFPGSGGVRVNFGAGTLVAGATIAFPTVAPKWNNTEITDAITALRNTKIDWELCEVVGPIDATAFDVIETAFASMFASNKDKAWIGHVRNNLTSETHINYTNSISGAFAEKATVLGSVTAGAGKTVSGVSGRVYRRPFCHRYSALVAGLSEEIDAAELRFLLSGFSIRDANGNPDEFDESITPGLGDRFVTARTWEDEEGVYVNNPRLLCPAGSDYEFLQHRRVMNIGRSALRRYLQRRLSKIIYVSRRTGFILEEEAVDIELGATKAVRSRLNIPLTGGQGGKASDAFFVCSRTDNLLSTKTLTGDGKIIPLAYPKIIVAGMSFFNPALQVVAV